MDTGTDEFADLMRSIFLFDTSALTSGATVTGAVLSLFGVSAKIDDGTAITPDIDIYTSTPASNTVLAATDFGNIGTTSQTGSPIGYSSWSDSAYNNFTFNGTGIGNISKTGVSKFAAQNANYDAANTPPTWSNSSSHAVFCNYAAAAGTSTDPKLVVTYSPASAIKTVDGLAVASVKTIDGLATGSVKTWNGLT